MQKKDSGSSPKCSDKLLLLSFVMLPFVFVVPLVTLYLLGRVSRVYTSWSNDHKSEGFLITRLYLDVGIFGWL